MTRNQVERAAQFLHELAVAVCIGSGADLVVVNSRRALVVLGLFGCLMLFAFSLKLTGRLGGPRL